MCSVCWEWHGVVDAEENLVQKTLTDISEYTELVARLARNTRSDATAASAAVDDEETEGDEGTAYGLDDAEEELFFGRAELQKWLTTLSRKKNVILQGPPGVGKTFVADWLATLLIGRNAPSHRTMVQFHPSYGYEDFVQGYRPTAATIAAAQSLNVPNDPQTKNAELAFANSVYNGAYRAGRGAGR
jgi:5-methylcytosine-specific restriction protein B